MRKTLTLLALVAIFAVLIGGCSSKSSNPVSPIPDEDTTPPTAPLDVTVHVKDGAITVAWISNSESDLNGYRVYRKINDEAFGFMGVVQNARFLETAPEYSLMRLTYRVSAYDESGNESAYSVPVQITVDNTLPTPVEG